MTDRTKRRIGKAVKRLGLWSALAFWHVMFWEPIREKNEFWGAISLFSWISIAVCVGTEIRAIGVAIEEDES